MPRGKGSQTLSESELLRWIWSQGLPEASATAVRIGSGDDCAELQGSGPCPLLLTTDTLLEGVHFQEGVAPRRAGYKAMAVSLSDIAAMGGRPMAAVCAVAFPSGMPPGADRELYAGLRDALDRFDVPLVGGDVTAWSGGLALTSTLLGLSPEDGAIGRGGARPGDVLFITGELGGSILGRHMDFLPRVREGRMLAERYSPRAMIDVSDGLATDALHLAAASGCGVEIHAAAVPVAAAARTRAASTGRDALHHALHDGEDFELLFAVRAEDAVRIEADRPFAGTPPVRRIGRFVEADASVLLCDGGARLPLNAGGWEHAWGRDG